MQQRIRWSNIERVTVARILEDHLREGCGSGQAFRDLVEVIEADGGEGLDLDLDAVSRISASGLGRLVLLRNLVSRQDGMIRLRNVIGRVREALAVTRLDQLFEIQTEAESHPDSQPAEIDESVSIAEPCSEDRLGGCNHSAA